MISETTNTPDAALADPAFPSTSTPRDSASFGEMHLQLLEQYAPPSVLVNNASEVVHLSPHANKYLQLAPGEISINLLSLVHPSLRLELRAAMFRAIQSGEPTQALGVRLELEGEAHSIDIRVRPMRDARLAPGAAPPFLLVIFEDAPQGLGEGLKEGSSALGRLEEPVARQIEAELDHVKENLRQTIEQYESSNQELKASNEELQATNEELRSSGEELEAGKEEIQAANQELNALNQEMRLHVAEVSRVNADLQNLMSSTEIATIFLDRDLHIQRYTPRALELFQLIPSDLGRPLSDLRHSFEQENFSREVEQVLGEGQAIEREVSARDGRFLILRVLPYCTAEGEVNGVVLTFLDISKRKIAEEALAASTRRYRTLFHSIDEGFAVAQVLGDAPIDLRLLEFNPRFEKLLGFADSTVQENGKTLRQIAPDLEEPWYEIVSRVAHTGQATRFELHSHAPERWLDVYAFRVDEPEPNGNENAGENGAPRVAMLCSDISTRKQRERSLAFSVEVNGDFSLGLEAAAISSAVGERLCKYLGLARVAFFEVDEEADIARGVYEHKDADLSSLLSLGRARDVVLLDAACELQTGRAVAIEDASASSLQVLGARGEGVRAQVLASAARDGACKYLICAQKRQPHAWRADEVGLLGEVASRLYARIERERNEAALRESDERYHALFESMDEGFCIIEVIFDGDEKPVDVRFLEANPAFERQSGMVNALGRTMREIAPETDEALLAMYGQVLQSEQGGRSMRTVQALGRWFDFFSSRVGGPNSRKVAVVFQDITERKKSEQALVMSEERMRLAIESASIFTWEYDVPARRTAFAPNAEVVRGFAMAYDSGAENGVSDAGILAIVHPDDRGRMEEFLVAMQNEISPVEIEYRLLHPETGEALWMMSHAVIVPGEDGQERFVGITQNISARKSAEAASRKSERQYLELFNSIDEGFGIAEVLFDDADEPVDFRILEANPRWQELMEVPLSEALSGKTMRQIEPGLESKWHQMHGQVAKTRQAERFEATMRTLDRTFDVYSFPIDAPEKRRVGILFSDISARKRAEANFAFLAEVQQEIATLVSAGEIIEVTARRIARHFGFSLFSVWDVGEQADSARLVGSSHGFGASNVAPEMRLSEFFLPSQLASLRKGEVVQISDIARDIAHYIAIGDEAQGEQAQAFEALEARSLLAAPYASKARWKFLLCGTRREPSQWRADESELLREMAERLHARLERAQAEAALRDSEERLRIAIEAGELGTWDWNVTRNETRWNEQHFRLFGMKPREGPLHPDDFLCHVHPDDLPRINERLQRAMTTLGTYNEEFRAVREDTGEVRWMTGYGRVVEAEGGRATRMCGVMFDSSARHEAEEVLRRSHDEMQRLVRERAGELARVNEALQAEVSERKRAESGREMLLRRLVSTQEEERRRISRELHDQMGQTLTALMMGLKSLPDIPDTGLAPPSPNQTIQRLQSITTELMNEVHHLAWELRPAVLDNLGLKPALEQYVRDWAQRTGVRGDFLSHGLSGERPPEHIESALYRVVQEALTNVARHSNATRASVLLERVEGEVVAIVEDDGDGFDAETQAESSSSRLGVAGMRERVEIVGGTLTIESSPGTGTTIYARVPVGRPVGKREA